MTIKNEFVRLTKNDPLTLLCSAISDFLWDDFIRDARPVVNYLQDQYNIKQLSRFGKEVFDRLYTADQVEWLVSEEDYEQFFRKTCDGESPAMPQGYKPENAFWWMLMSELSNAAAWPELVARCVGNQFNAGNNAINIINQLAEELEVAIENCQIDVETVFNSGEQLDQLREQFKKAVAEGDKEAAGKAREAGKRLGNKIVEASQRGIEQIQRQIDFIVDETIKQNNELSDAISNLWGTQPGVGKELTDLNEKRKLAKQLNNNAQLKKLAAQLGALKRTWIERKRAARHKANYESIVGAEFGNDITKAFSTELALANTAEGRALFALKYSQKTLLMKNYEANSKNLGKGPIIMYVDISGSMCGALELWSKALTFVIADQALKERREVQVNLFDVRIENSTKLKSDRKNNNNLIDFIGKWSTNGGTQFNSVIIHAINEIPRNKQADVLMITDGASMVSMDLVKELNISKISNGAQWSTLCLQRDVPEVCYQFSDDVYRVDIGKPADAIDAVQKSLR
jgi:uncharacterized protein with von Willebrand factor type A (vWA) domain